MSRTGITKALKLLTDDESVKAAIVFTAYYIGEERVDAKVGTAGSELDDPIVRRTLAQSLRAIADQLEAG